MLNEFSANRLFLHWYFMMYDSGEIWALRVYDIRSCMRYKYK